MVDWLTFDVAWKVGGGLVLAAGFIWAVAAWFGRTVAGIDHIGAAIGDLSKNLERFAEKNDSDHRSIIEIGRENVSALGSRVDEHGRRLEDLSREVREGRTEWGKRRR